MKHTYRKQVRASVVVTLEDGTKANAVVVVPAFYEDANDILEMATEALTGEELEIGKVVRVESLRYAQLAG